VSFDFPRWRDSGRVCELINLLFSSQLNGGGANGRLKAPKNDLIMKVKVLRWRGLLIYNGSQPKSFFFRTGPPLLPKVALSNGGSFLRKGEVFAYLGRNQNLKDLKHGIEDHRERGGGMSHTMVECGTTAGEGPRGTSGSYNHMQSGDTFRSSYTGLYPQMLPDGGVGSPKEPA